MLCLLQPVHGQFVQCVLLVFKKRKSQMSKAGGGRTKLLMSYACLSKAVANFNDSATNAHFLK